MESKRHGLLALGAIAFLLIFWSPAIFIPYWQDDYGFLLQAREAASRHESWFSDFVSTSRSCFWRPLSVGLYWRFVEQTLNGDACAAHALNLVLLAASSAAVGWLVAALLRVRFPEIDARFGGILAGVLYGVHGARFLPVAWACGVQESFLILFSALTLRFWLVAITADGAGGILAAAAILPCAALAFLSKETAIILPVLAMILAAWIGPNKRLARRTWLLGAALIAITGLWWLIHQRLVTQPPPEQYRMQLGMNVLRNGACLSLFLLNMPRETVRFVLTEHSLTAAIWGVTCVALQLGGCVVLWRVARDRIRRWDVCLGIVFLAVGLAPHLPMGWNCYEYYASMGLMAYAILVGMAAQRTRWMWTGAAMIVLSSAIGVAGNYLLPYPSLIARAHWSQRQLDIVREMRDADPRAFQTPIYLNVEDPHKFLGMSVPGLAYTLGLRVNDFVPLPSAQNPPRPSSTVLVVPAEGDVLLHATER